MSNALFASRRQSAKPLGWLLVPATALLLAGCGVSEEELDAKVAAAEAAANKAVEAQKAAETAAAEAKAAPQQTVIEDEPEPEPDPDETDTGTG